MEGTSSGRARLHRLRKNFDSGGFWEGHDFSRAVKSFRFARALAPEVCFLRPRLVFPQPLQSCRQEPINTRALAPEGRTARSRTDCFDRRSKTNSRWVGHFNGEVTWVSFTVDRNNWGRTLSRAFRESLPCFAEAPSEAEGDSRRVARRTADTVRPRLTPPEVGSSS